jgi:sugar phosphate permease
MAEFGFDKTTMGLVLTALFTAYAFGQFVNGQLGDKFGARKMVFVGIMGSALMNFLFPFASGLWMMIAIWALNGYLQSMGWAPTIKTIANWFPSDMRGKIGGMMGTSYQVGNAYSWALAGFLVGMLGWRWAFWVPAIIFALSGIHWALRIRNAPEEVGLPTIEEEKNGDCTEKECRKDEHLGFTHTLKLIASYKRIWVIAAAFFFLSIIRYGFIDWAVTYMFEVQKMSIQAAAIKSMAIPLAGACGALVAGYLTDAKFQSRRAPVVTIMLIGLAIAAYIYPMVAASDWLLSIIMLMLIGFLLYGPHVLLVAIAPMDFGTRKAASSVTGFVDGVGYLGAALTGVGSGWLIDQFGWHAAMYFWVAGALIAAALMATQWKYKPHKREFM